MLADNAQSRPTQTCLLMRELLDNKRRADTASTWYLKPFLERLTNLLRANPEWSKVNAPQALAVVYQLLGAINYYNVSGPTLTQMFGLRAYAKLQSEFRSQFVKTVRAALATHSSH